MLTVFTSEEAKTRAGRPLVNTLLVRAREAGLAGASVLRGIEGFGRSRRVRTTRFPDVSVDLPVVVQIVDLPARIEEFLPVLRDLVQDELVMIQPVVLERLPREDHA